MSAIFISHSSHDNGFAQELRARLQDHGYRSLFLDFDPADGIPAGRHWEQELYRQLRACRAVIVLCSEQSMASDWCFAEITHARALGKLIFPLRIGPCRLRVPLAELQVVDATGDRTAALNRLLRGLRAAGLEQLFAWDPSRPPYPGLMAFQEADAAVYFGREGEVRVALDALTRLRRFDGPRLLIFLGASGSGKSSLLRAGLLPRLKQAADDWVVLPPVRPLQRPLDELAMVLAPALGERVASDWKAIAGRLEQAAATPADAASLWARWLRELRHGAGARTVVFSIDQFEEALGPSPQADRFLRLLGALVADPDRQAVVLGTLRSDFLEALQKHQSFRAPFDTLPIASLGVEALVQVIEGPAQVAGLEVERGLTECLVADTDTDDGLPLLAFMLRELWERDGKGGRLKAETYRDTLGGMQGAVARAAEGVVDIDRLGEAERRDLQFAFLALVRINEAGQYTRQAARWDDLPAGALALLERFVDARLLVSGREAQGRVLEVAHEALFRVWKRLREWLDADRELLRLREGVRRAAAEWSERSRPADLLVHRGSRLEAAESQLYEGRFALDPVQSDYLQACIAAREAQLAAERARTAARRRRVRITVVGLAAGLAVAIALSVWAIRERAQATDRLADLHWANGIADRDVGQDPLKALHHFVQTAALAKDPQDARSAVVAGHLVAGIAALQGIVEPASGIASASFGIDASQLVVWSPDGAVARWTIGDTEPEVHALRDADAGRVVPSPQSRWLVSLAPDGGATILDGLTAQPWVTSAHADDGPVFDAAESRVAMLEDRVVRIFDASARTPRAPLKHPARVVGAAFSPDGRHLLTWDSEHTARLWPVDGDGQPVELLTSADIVGGVVADDGAEVLLWSRQAPAWIWRPTDGGSVALRVDTDSVPGVMGARFVAGGRGLLTWNYGGVGSARLWDTGGGTQRLQLRHDGAIRSVATDRAGGRLLSWSDDGTAVLWDVRDGSALAVLAHRAGVRGAILSADEARVLTWSDDGTARVWDAATGYPLTLPLHHHGVVRGASWGPGGRSVLSWDTHGARLWRLDESSGVGVAGLPSAGSVMLAAFGSTAGELLTLTRDGRLQRWLGMQPVGEPIGPPRDLTGATFDHERKRVAVWTSRDTIEIRSVDQGHALTPPMRHDPSDFGIRGAVFDADDRRLLTWGDDRSARLWDSDNGRSLAVLRHPAPVAGAALGGDATRLVTWAEDRIVRLWDLPGGDLLRAWPPGAFGITGALLLPDGTRLVAWDTNGSIRAYDTGTGQPTGTWGHGAGFAIAGARLSDDGQRLLSWDDRGGVRLWDMTKAPPPDPQAAWSVRGLRAAALSHDKRWVLTWGDDGARLWDGRTGQPLSGSFLAAGAVVGAALRADDCALLAWSDRALRVWDFGADLDRPEADAAQRVEARTGTRLDRNDQIELLDADAWQVLRRQFGSVRR